MDIAITCAGPNEAQELRSLREWLPKADPELERLLAPAEPSPGHLGGEMFMDVLNLISTTADLVALCTAVSGWVHNRFGRQVDTRPRVTERRDGDDTVTTVEVGPVTITITARPGEPGPVVTRDEG